jgi:general secretion pathway protein A
MYCRYFGFSEKPFKATPDPKFLFLSEFHEEALRTIVCGIHERSGILSITGEVGTGKTTVLYAAQNWLSAGTRCAFIPNYALGFDDLLMLILSELDLARIGEKISKIEAIDRLKRFAAEQYAMGGTLAVLIDEAQNLRRDDLERVRLLSNLETRSEKLVQFVLCGQPELDHKLDAPDLRQLKQRICRRIRLKALGPVTTGEYLQHRLGLVSRLNGDFFDPATAKELWKSSEGIPRRINILCDNALRIAFERKVKRLNPSIITDAVSELGW